MTKEELMKMMDKKVENDKLKAIKDAEDIANETERLIEQIKELKPRIDDLIELANYAKRNGIEIDHRDVNHEDYEHGTFISNGWSHVVGFIKAPKDADIIYMGQIAGGACGSWNFATDGEEVFDYHENDGRKREPSIEHMKHFIKRFQECEKAFHKYIEDKCKG